MNLRTLLSPILLFLYPILWPVSSHAGDGSQVAARYAISITEEELDGWLEHVQRPDSTTREFDLQELALVKSLAMEAVWLGLDREVETRLELELKEAALAEATLRKESAASVKISKEQIEAKYEEYEDTFTQPRRVRLRNLFKRYPPNADSAAKAAVRAEMEKLRQRLVAGEDFKELAAAHSDSQTRFQGGLIGNVPAGTLAPEVDALAMAMKPGELSDILTGPDGLTLLFCEKILPKVVRSPEELREIAHLRLKNRTARKRWETTQAEWLAAAQPRYNWHVLESEVSLPGAAVVEFVGGELSRRQLSALMGSPRPLEQIPRQQVQRRVEAYLSAHTALREVERRGLDEFEGLETRWLWARRQALAAKASVHLVQQRFEELSEEEIRSYYDLHRESFVRPVHFDLAAILLPPVGNDPRESFRQGELIVHRIEAGETSFGEAAGLHSRHPSAQTGGRLGWISRAALPHVYSLKILRAILRMKPGELSGLVEDGKNLWIFKLLDVEEERPMTWEEARLQAEDRLGSERAQKLETELRQERLEALRIAMVSRE